jgi:hypothetical protein
MTFVYLAMITAGVAGAAWGLNGAHTLRKPWDILAAAVSLCGIIAALLGALLISVPGFFE